MFGWFREREVCKSAMSYCLTKISFVGLCTFGILILLSVEFLAGLGRCVRPGVSDVVLPDISVQPVGEVEEPAVFGH